MALPNQKLAPAQDTGGRADSARTGVAGFGRSSAGKATAVARKADQTAAENQYRKNHNTGVFSKFEELMTLKHVRSIASDMGIDLSGSKLQIIRDQELADRPKFMGYTFPDGSAIQLYPAAFINREQLVKTIGHEFVHLKQAKEHGIITSMEDLMEREREAYGSEAKWWDNYYKKTGFGR